MSRSPILSVRGLTRTYDTANGGLTVLKGVDLDVMPGEMVGLIGPSGSGKSSLLHLFLGLSPLTAGEVEVGGAHLSQAGDFAGQIAWASQNPVVVPGSLGDNIRIADPSACPGRILVAAGEAGLFGDLDRPIDERGGGLRGRELGALVPRDLLVVGSHLVEGGLVRLGHFGCITIRDARWVELSVG